MVDLSELTSILLLRDYNTRLVVLSTILLGVNCGLMGSFLLLRKRALMGDALSHATLPGIGIAFLLLTWIGADAKSLPGLMIGAGISGLLATLSIGWIVRHTRIKQDAAMGIVLSVFYGFGVVLLSSIQSLPSGSAAGLESFIYGKTASIVWSDFQLLFVLLLLTLLLVLLYFKELSLLCFDEAFASSQGFSLRKLDFLLLVLVTLVTVAGMLSVGLILIIAFLVIPAAAARMWTQRMRSLFIVSACIGGLSGWLGACLSACLPKLPPGALIVLVATLFFILSLVFGSEKGVLIRYFRSRVLRMRVGRQHLLRALYEILEADSQLAHPDEKLQSRPVAFRLIRGRRTWSDQTLRQLIKKSTREGFILKRPQLDPVQLSEAGFYEAARITRNHRLWELYLIEHADIAPNRVDQDADRVEHILGLEMVRDLERKLDKKSPFDPVQLPASPHPIHPVN